jgi:hypothetical protein
VWKVEEFNWQGTKKHKDSNWIVNCTYRSIKVIEKRKNHITRYPRADKCHIRGESVNIKDKYGTL